MMMAHDTSEKRKRMKRTERPTQLLCETRPTMPPEKAVP